MTTTSKAYSYVRFSTKDQIKGDSLRRQTETTARWCQEHKVELVESYRDLGVSAFKGSNAQIGALGAFLKLVESGKIPKGSYLIVESLDRLSRQDILKALKLFIQIIDAGIVLVTLSDGRVYEQSKIEMTDLIISLSVMSRANDESRMKSQRIGAAWMSKRKSAGTQPMTAKCVGWLKLADDRKTFNLIPDRAAVVKNIFEQARSGVGAYSIAKRLRQQKVKTFGRSSRWFPSYIKKILDSRAVIGEFTPATKRNGSEKTFLDPIPGYYPAVIRKELFATVQQLRRARPSYKGRSGFNVFSKLAFDRATGTTMSYVNNNRDKGWHYLVSAAALVQEAEYTAWPYSDFLARFLTVCQKAALEKAAPIEKSNGELAVKRMDLAECEKQVSRLVDFLTRGGAASVETKLREAEATKAELKKRIAELESETIAKPADVSKVDWTDHDALRENLRATVKRITIDAKAKYFKAEFFDGRVYEYQQIGDRVKISTPEIL